MNIDINKAKQEALDEVKMQSVREEVAVNINKVAYRTSGLATMQAKAKTAGLGPIVKVILQKEQAALQEWINDGDTDELDVTLDASTDTDVIAALDTQIPDNVKVGEYIVTYLANVSKLADSL